MHKQSAAASILGFFGLTFAGTWAFFILAVVLSGSPPSGAPLGLGAQSLVLFGTFVPALVALALTARAEGGAGVRALLGRLFLSRVGAQWYVFAVSYAILIKLAAALLHRLLTGGWPRFGFETWYLMAAATVFSTVIGGQVGEETGWRGYALPRLAARFGLGPASIVLGVIWAFWHLPLFYLRGADTYGQSFLVYVLQVIAWSIAIAWLYWRTHGSLLLTMLMHAAINNMTGIVPSVPRPATNPFWPSASALSWLTLAVLWATAAYLLVRMRGVDLIASLRASESTAPPHPRPSSSTPR